MAREAARGVLPNSTETKIVVTANARAWRTMLELRSSEGAELEIRRLAVAVLRMLQEEAPGFFSDFEIYEAEDRREAARISLPQSLSASRGENFSFARTEFSIIARKNVACISSRALLAFAREHLRASRVEQKCARVRDESQRRSPHTIRDGMTRIGFAYNQKPEPEAADAAAELSRADEEPPSSAGGATPSPRWSLRAGRRVRRVGLRRNDRRRRPALSALRRSDSPRGDATISPSGSAPRAPTSSSTSPKDCTARIARRTSPRSASSTASRTPAATRSRCRSASTRRGRRRSSAPTASRPRDWMLVRIRRRASTRLVARRRRTLPALRQAGARGLVQGNHRAQFRRATPTRSRADRRRSPRDATQQPVLVEDFLPGAEFTCGVLGNGADARACCRSSG